MNITSILYGLYTFILVLANGYSIYHNRRVLKEMIEARKAEFFPRLKATLNFEAPTFVDLKIQNIGKGPATDIEGRISITPGENIREWKQLLMAPGESEFFLITKDPIDKLIEKYEYVIIKCKYKDIFGEEYHITEKIYLKKYLKDLEILKKLWKESELEKNIGYLKKLDVISDEIKEIRNCLQKLKRMDSEPERWKYERC